MPAASNTPAAPDTPITSATSAIPAMSAIATPSLSAADRLDLALAELPLVAILRGVTTDAAEAIVEALFDAGFRVAEVPLNSPDAFATIERLVRRFGERMVIGAGTVTDVDAVRRLAATGALVCVAPNTDTAVIRAAVDAGLAPMPGYATPSEAFAAIGAGARHLKLFPAAGRETDLGALRAVLPAGIQLLAVGGATPADLGRLMEAGAHGAGIGSNLYRPGDTAEQVGERARAWRDAFARTRQPSIVERCWQPEAVIGEGPVLRPDGRTVCWVDPVRQRLMRWDGVVDEGEALSLETPVNALVSWPTPSPGAAPAGTTAHATTGTTGTTASATAGALVGALDDGLCLVDERTGALDRRARAKLDAGCRFNDMTGDSLGGLWIGAMHKGLLATRGALYHASGVDAPIRRVADGLGVPNGMAFDADERMLFLIDTLSRHLLAFPVDVVQGQLGQPTIVTDFLDLPGKPDGMTIAPDGDLWVAMWGGGCLLRLARNGAVKQTVRLPALHVSSVCAGADGTLWATTSRARQTEAQLARTPHAGALFRIRPN